MTTTKKIIGVVAVCIVAAVLYIGFEAPKEGWMTPPAPESITLSGVYVCLPHVSQGEMQTQECKFGLKSDTGEYYAVNFGAGAEAMNQFNAGAAIRAEGFVVLKEALSSSEWAKYTMKGIFTITKMLSTAPVAQKLNIDVVCQSALSYMSFPDGKSADAFVAACKNGEHPEVIEHYKQQMGLGDGAAI